MKYGLKMDIIGILQYTNYEGGKRNMNKITIKTFCKEYNNRANDTLKKQYIKDNLEITPYVSFVKKMLLSVTY